MFDNFQSEVLGEDLAVVTDDFDRDGPQPTLGNNWEQILPDPNQPGVLPRMEVDIFGHVLHSGTTNPASVPALAVHNGVYRTDLAVEADILLPADVVNPATSRQSAGLVLRYQGPYDQRYYGGIILRNTDGVFGVIYRMDSNNSFTILAMSNNLNINTVDRFVNVRFEAEGAMLGLLVNDVRVTWTEDSVISTPGRAGIRSTHDGGGNTITFDNFKVESVDSKFITADFSDNFDRGPSVSMAEGDTANNWTSVGSTTTEPLSSLPVQIDSQGRAHAEIAVAHAFRATDAAASADIYIDPLAPDDTYGGIFLRYTGVNPNYGESYGYYGAVVTVQGDSVFLDIWYRNPTSGNTQSLLAQPVQLDRGRIPLPVTMELEVVADTLILSVNGVSKVSVQDTRLANLGFTGFFSNDPDNVWFDNFSAEQR